METASNALEVGQSTHSVSWLDLPPFETGTRSPLRTLLFKVFGVVLIAAACDGPVDAVSGGVSSVSITSSSSYVPASSTAPFTAKALDEGGAAINGVTFAWKSSDPAVATVDQSGKVRGVAPGSTTITASAEGKSASAEVSVTAAPPIGTLPELPRQSVDVTMPVQTGQVWRPMNGKEFQDALDNASLGDVIELEAGRVYDAVEADHRFVLRPRSSGSGWIVIRSSQADRLPAGRVSPADSVYMPTLLGGERTGSSYPVLMTVNGAHHYRFVGVRVALRSSTTGTNMLVNLDYSTPSSTSVPHHLIFDRVYIHGHDNASIRRCMVVNSAHTAVINSYLDKCHGTGEAQGIVGYAGPGPFLIENNYIAASAINILFGGAVPPIEGLIPSDITVRRNHLHKPTWWKGKWPVKNLFELKNAQRVLVEGNVMENNWADAQAGFAINLKSEKSGTGSWGQWIVTQDVTFRDNKILNSLHGVTLIGKASNPDEWSSEQTRRVRFENNLFEVEQRSFQAGGPTEDIIFERNWMTGSWLFYGSPIYRIAVLGNALLAPVKREGFGNGTASMEEAFRGYAWEGNAVAGEIPLYKDSYPQGNGNEYPDTLEGYTGPAGVDRTRLEAATQGVVQ